jgi:hypothetical protein
VIAPKKDAGDRRAPRRKRNAPPAREDALLKRALSRPARRRDSKGLPRFAGWASRGAHSALKILSFFFLISVFSLSAPARASCFNPAGAAGDVRYNGAYTVMQYCNGGAWVNIGHVGNITGGLAGWWKLDDGAGTSAADSSGNGNTGTLVNGPAWTTSGINNGALNFVYASSTSVTASDVSSLQLWGSWTASAWINPSALPAAGNYVSLVEKDAASFHTNYGIWLDNGGGGLPNNGLGWAVVFQDIGGIIYYAKYVPAAPITTGAWYLVTGVWDASTSNLYLYVNGALVATQNETGHVPDARSGHLLSLGSFVTGTLDDARVYNRALSAADIMTLYTSTGGASGDINTGLAGYWKLDESSGTLANDSTGNGNTGTLTNGPTWAAGKINNALTLNGTNQYVDAGNAASLQITGSITLTAWVNASALGGTPSSILGKSNPGTSNRSYALNIDPTNCGGAQKFDMVVSTDGTAYAIRCSSTAAVTGTWYFVADVYDASAQTLHVYVNGALSDGTLTGTVPASLFNTTANVNLGRRNNNIDFFNGTIDDARIYSRALSASDVLTLYNATASVCASPVGYAGDEIYNAGANHVPQYCNGSSWIKMGKVPGAGGAGCSNPAGSEGNVMYNKDYRVAQYCDGTNWVAMGGVIPITGLVGWWNLDEGSGTSAADSSGNNNTGTLTNGPTWTTGGKINGAVTFSSASSQYVSVPYSAALEPTTALTVSAWVKPNAATGEAIIASPDNNGWTAGWRLVVDGSPNLNATIVTTNTSPRATAIKVPGPAAGIWTHVAFVYDGSTFTAYENGIAGTPTAVTGTIVYGANQYLPIGHDPGVSYFDGQIDDVRIYNRALGAGEIQHLYNGGP